MVKQSFYYLWTTGRGLYVLLGLLFWGIFISPLMIATGTVSDLLAECVFALVLIAGACATPCSKTIRYGVLFVAILAVIARILHKYDHTDFVIVSLDNVLAAITLIAFSVLIIKHYLIDKTLLRYRIIASVAVYLVFGVLWARLYEMVYLLNPMAFSPHENINIFSLLYFSFVTLVTLGYGDIVPVSMAARSLAILEGVVGQLYMVIIIASFVSEFSAVAIKSSNELK